MIAVLQKLNLVQGPDLDSFETVISHEHLPQIQLCRNLPAEALTTLSEELIAYVFRASSLNSGDPSRHWCSINGEDHLNPRLRAKRLSVEHITKFINESQPRLIAMLKNPSVLNEHLDETLRLYLNQSFEEDQVAKLDQAGETDLDRTTLLREVFVDLELKPRKGELPHRLKQAQMTLFDDAEKSAEVSILDPEKVLSAMESFLKELWPMIVIIGGPGQGKSTLGQYLAQVHRGILTKREKVSIAMLPQEKRYLKSLSQKHSVYHFVLF